VDTGALEDAGLESTLHDAVLEKRSISDRVGQGAAILGRQAAKGNGVLQGLPGRLSAESRRDEAVFPRPALLSLI
jgi:hypothetical protein